MVQALLIGQVLLIVLPVLGIEQAKPKGPLQIVGSSLLPTSDACFPLIPAARKVACRSREFACMNAVWPSARPTLNSRGSSLATLRSRPPRGLRGWRQKSSQKSSEVVEMPSNGYHQMCSWFSFCACPESLSKGSKLLLSRFCLGLQSAHGENVVMIFFAILSICVASHLLRVVSSMLTVPFQAFFAVFVAEQRSSTL